MFLIELLSNFPEVIRLLGATKVPKEHAAAPWPDRKTFCDVEGTAIWEKRSCVSPFNGGSRSPLGLRALLTALSAASLHIGKARHPNLHCVILHGDWRCPGILRPLWPIVLQYVKKPGSKSKVRELAHLRGMMGHVGLLLADEYIWSEVGSL